MQEEPLDGSSSSDDSSDSDDSEDDADAVEIGADDAQRLMELEADLEASPKAYDKHVEYITLLRKTPLKQRLHDAHEAFAAQFPLSEALWLAWLEDELETLSDAEGVTRVEALLRKAVQDYLSPTLWGRLQQFRMEYDADVKAHTATGIAKIRNISDEALAAAGLHLPQGSQVWANLRQYEVELHKVGGGGSQQRGRVSELFRRQLAVPLADTAQTFAEYTAWESCENGGKGVPEGAAEEFARTMEQVDVRAASEAAVAADKPADLTKLGAYLAYIKLEQVQGNPARVQCVFERALAAFPVTHSLWLQYGQYLETHVKVPAVVNAVYARAVRNCYWMGTVWARALRAIDRYGGASACDEEERMYRSALTAGLQGVEDYMEVLLAHLDALRHRCMPTMPSHVSTAPAATAAAATTNGAVGSSGSSGGAKKSAAAGSRALSDPAAVTTSKIQVPDPAAVAALRAGFAEASTLLARYFPEYVDPLLRIPGYWAHFELHLMGDLEAARAVWEGLLKGPYAKHKDPWSAYASQERMLRNIPGTRAIYKRGYNRKFESFGHLAFCNEWLRFEREEGSAEDVMAVTLKIEPILEAGTAAVLSITNQQAAAAAKVAAQQAPKLTPEEMTKIRQANDPNFGKGKDKKKKTKDKQKSGKRGRAEDATQPAAVTAEADGSNPAHFDNEQRAKKARTGAGPTFEQPGSVTPPLAGTAVPFTSPPKSETAMPTTSVPPPTDAAANDEDMADASEPSPSIAPAALAATAVAATAAGADTASIPTTAAASADLGSSRQHAEIDGGDQDMGSGEPSTSQAESHGGQDRRGSTPQRHPDQLTVYVRGLKWGLKDGQLDELFKPCGDIKAVRVVREPDGRAKGFGYVEFSSREGLERAVAMNGVNFQGWPLLIVESHPPTAQGEGGRGRGRGGRGGGGRDGGSGGLGRGGRRFGPSSSAGHEQHSHHQGRGRGDEGRGGRGGREGGGGGREGGRIGGRGLGFQGGGGSGRGGGRGNDGHEVPFGGSDQVPRSGHRQHLQLDDSAGAAKGPAMAFMPRAVAVTASGSAPPAGQPLSNTDFRSMLLGKSKEGGGEDDSMQQ